MATTQEAQAQGYTADDAPRKQGLSTWLWVGVAGAVLQLIALGSTFYSLPSKDKPGTREGSEAWQGIAHTADLILISAAVAIVLVALTVFRRSPMSGRGTGLWIGILGLLAALMLGYRMIAPPFALNVGGTETWTQIFSGDCQWFCTPSQASKADANLLPGIYFGIVGCVAVMFAGFTYAFSRAGRAAKGRAWVAPQQTGMTPWLGLAGLGAAAQFIFGYTFFTFYTTPGRMGSGATQWSGWLPTPHTSSLVLLMTIGAVWLVVLARKRRTPMSPASLGSVLALIGFITAARILYRSIAPPFGVDSGTQIGWAAWVALAAAVVLFVAGLIQVALYRNERPLARTPVPGN